MTQCVSKCVHTHIVHAEPAADHYVQTGPKYVYSAIYMYIYLDYNFYRNNIQSRIRSIQKNRLVINALTCKASAVYNFVHREKKASSAVQDYRAKEKVEWM